MAVEVEWSMPPVNSQAIMSLASELNLLFPIATIMVRRGLDTPELVQDFWDVGSHRLHNPYLLPDIKPVVARLKQAIENKEHIYVHGDYDVDGVTSTAVITHTLRLLGADFEYHVPHRTNDGYDVRKATVDKALKAGAKLLITVDCGIVAFEAANYAKEMGLDLIITDHHEPSHDGKIPPAIGVVNPNIKGCEYPFAGLAGVGIAFKVMVALGHTMGISVKKMMDELLDYVALGTVADVARMTDENRSLVALGCKLLTEARKPGIAELLKVAGVKKVDQTSIGFMLGPRINAIGRLGDAAVALDLMLERVPSRAAALADQLNRANTARQQQQTQAVEEAMELLPEDMSKTSVIVVGAKGWHAGLIGLISSRITEQMSFPSLVCTIKEDGKAKGSCRSPEQFHILDALKSEKVWPLFSRRGDGSVVGGGHAVAAGFELPAENLDKLREALNEYAYEITNGEGLKPKRVYKIDAQIGVNQVNEELLDQMLRIAPFGNGNPEPRFMLKGVIIEELKTLGKDGQHLKMRVKGPKPLDKSVNTLLWRRGGDADTLEIGQAIDIIGKISRDEFRGRGSLVITLDDYRPAQAK